MLVGLCREVSKTRISGLQCAARSVVDLQRYQVMGRDDTLQAVVERIIADRGLGRILRGESFLGIDAAVSLVT